MLLCSRARSHPPGRWQMSPQCLRKMTTLAFKTTVQYHCSAWSPQFLNATSTRKFCPFYSQLFPMGNTALCQIGLVLLNLLILLIILVLPMTGGVTPMLCSWTSRRHLTRSTIPSLLRSSGMQVSVGHSLPGSTIIWRADCREWSSMVRFLTCYQSHLVSHKSLSYGPYFLLSLSMTCHPVSHPIHALLSLPTMPNYVGQFLPLMIKWLCRMTSMLLIT